jgi:uncharacterized protein (TIGR04255 family)
MSASIDASALEFRNPPVQEAVLEIRFSPNPKVTFAHLEKFADAMGTQYPNRVKQQALDVNLDMDGAGMNHIGVTPLGIQLHSADNSRNIIAKADTVGVSFLRPYKRWPSIRETLQDVYLQYRRIVPQLSIIRLGMRYINRVELPSVGGNINRFLKAPPVLPQGEGLPQALWQFQTVVIIPLEEVDGIAVVKQAIIEPDEESKTVPFILDIDVVHTAADTGVDENSMWERFDKMRDVRNRIFLGCLHDNALEPYR